MSEEANGMTFNVIVKKEDGLFVAHCLELDIVATAKSKGEVVKDMGDLIVAHVDYAFSNDNLEYLYKLAPPEVWADFYKCKGHSEKKHPLRAKPGKPARQVFIPPWIITKTCQLEGAHAG